MGGKEAKKLGGNPMLIIPMLIGYSNRNKTISSDFCAAAYCY